MDNPELIIIGAGLSGLSLGALLAEEDKVKTLILEKDKNFGGRVKVWQRGGFLVDYGIHALLLSDKSSLSSLFKKIGMKLEVKGAGLCLYEEGEFRNLIGESVTSLKDMGRLNLVDIIKLSRTFLDSQLFGMEKYYSKSVEEWLKENQAGKDLTNFFKGLCIGLLATTSLGRASLGEIIQFLKLVIRKRRAIGYPEGGWSSILNPLVKKIKISKRVKLCLGEKVEKIIIRRDEVRGVKSRSNEFESRAVICAFPTQYLLRDNLLPEKIIPRDYREKLRKMRETAGISLEMGLKKRVSEEKRTIITLRPPSLGWLVSNVSEKVAPPGKQLLTIFSPVSVEELKDKNLLKKSFQTLYNYYCQIFPKIEDNLEWKRELPLIVNGAELNTNQSLNLRPPIRFPEIKNLFLIGDTVAVAGAGGEMAVRSAIKCKQILGVTIQDLTP